MRIVVMSDTHLNHPTEEFREICSRYCDQADLVIHLGDWARSTILDYLEGYSLQAVAGNMDDHAILQRLPAKKVIRTGKYRLGIIHGWGSSRDLRQRLAREFEDVDAILYGHSHLPYVQRENGLLWFNPGSVFMGRGDLPGSIGILHADEELWGEIIPL
ncbi:MAG: YfcE family phosphodiesterase [Syntrophobacteraceae bacterium]|jgi:putative phosphoesterase|nr:YfcE family phosphodiesterase [Syntrophobacteraceae bacterium]